MAKYCANLGKRAAIRRGEMELNLKPAQLPSEDEVMDNPARNRIILDRLLRAQAKIRKAIGDYGVMDYRRV